MTTVLARSLFTCAHRARLVHAVTGEPIPLSAVTLVETPPTWTVRLQDNEAIVVAPKETKLTPGSTPGVLLTIATGARHRLLMRPDDDPWTVRLELNGSVVEKQLAPAPADLTVRLVRPVAGTPSTGRTVTLRAAHGDAPHPVIPLTERQPGAYGAGNITWTAPFVTADLMVDGSPLHRIAVDVHSQRTQIQLVDTI